MMRSTQEGTCVWFQLDVRPDFKITWPIELYLLFTQQALREPALRCELWDQGEILELTEQDRKELSLARPRLKAKAAGAAK